MKNTEHDVIKALVEALMGCPLNFNYHATGHYVQETRRINLDFGATDVGPLIGQSGSMKLAIQSILACPFGGDACQIVMTTTRGDRREGNAAPCMLEPRLERLLKTIQEHYPQGRFLFKLERSPSAMVVLIESGGVFLDDIRGALAKAIRSIGRRHGMVAVVSIEKPAPAWA